MNKITVEELNIYEPINQMFDSFMLVQYLSILNCMFFTSQILQFIFLRIIKRTFTFPTIGFFTDAILFALSLYTIYWVQAEIMANVYLDGSTIEEQHLRKLANIQMNSNFKFEYLFSGMIACLIWKILEIV